MGFPGLRNLRSRLSDSGDGDAEESMSAAEAERMAKQPRNQEQITVGGDTPIEITVPDNADVDPEDVEAAFGGNIGGDIRVRGAAAGDSTVTPVASGSDSHLSDSAFDQSNWEYFIGDDRIKNIEKNSIDYNQRIGDWAIDNDDLVPGILNRLKGLLLGRDGLSVEPADSDSDADQRLAEHQRDIYAGRSDLEAQVDPTAIVDQIIEENVKNSVWVGRTLDLHHLDVDTLGYVKDGDSGEEVYVQQPTGYTTFDVDEDTQEIDVNREQTTHERALKIGDEVLDVRLYRNPPLQAVIDDIVTKKQLKRLKGRKAEIASIGGIIIRVDPPGWLPEEDYDRWINESDNDFGDKEGRLLELVMDKQVREATETLQDYQTATVMSVPENWHIETVELPEMDQSFDDMIRGYNEAIARRLLVPMDLLELEKGSELSRDTIFNLFLNTISGWQAKITDMFDEFARIQAEIYDIDGEVTHRLPSLSTEDEEQIVKLLNFAGMLGLSESEARNLVNTLEGVDLEENPTEGMPEAGGPEDGRQQATQEMLQNQTSSPQQPGGDAGGGMGQSQSQDGEPAEAADAGEFLADVFRVVAPEDERDRFEDDILGIGIDFPNSGVYVDWRNSVFPDELENPHVSMYGSVGDLEKATGNEAVHMEQIGVEAANAYVESGDIEHIAAAIPKEIRAELAPDPESGPDQDPTPSGDSDGFRVEASGLEAFWRGTLGGTFDDNELDAARDALNQIRGVQAIRSAENHDPGLLVTVDRSLIDGRLNLSEKIRDALEDTPFGGLSEEWEWKEAARGEASAAGWQPDEHPRGPDGRFIDVFSQISDILDSDKADWQKRENIQIVASGETGASVRFDEFTPEQAATAAEEIIRLDRSGETDGINGYQSAISQRVGSESVDAAGAYVPQRKRIEISPEHFRRESTQEWASDGYLASEDPTHLVRHEIGHHQHFEKHREGEIDLGDVKEREFTDDEQDMIASELSEYAARNPLELVAEGYGVLAGGDSLPPGVRELYDELGGPEPEVSADV